MSKRSEDPRPKASKATEVTHFKSNVTFFSNPCSPMSAVSSRRSQVSLPMSKRSFYGRILDDDEKLPDRCHAEALYDFKSP